MNIEAATASLIAVLEGREGFFVAAPPNGKVILVAVHGANEEDRRILRLLTRDGWEGWKVKIEGMI
jgi:hypothetical protein